VWLDRFRFDHRSTHHERGFAALDNQDVHLRFVKLGAAVACAMRDSYQMVFIGGQLFPSELLIVDFTRELLAGILDGGALPQPKTLRIGGME
jgi:hypothetical protein